MINEIENSTFSVSSEAHVVTFASSDVEPGVVVTLSLLFLHHLYCCQGNKGYLWSSVKLFKEEILIKKKISLEKILNKRCPDIEPGAILAIILSQELNKLLKFTHFFRLFK